jgi:hypothetical protein
VSDDEEFKTRGTIFAHWEKDKLDHTLCEVTQNGSGYSYGFTATAGSLADKYIHANTTAEPNRAAVIGGKVSSQQELVSDICTTFAKIKAWIDAQQAGVPAREAPIAEAPSPAKSTPKTSRAEKPKPAYDYRLLGRGKSDSGERLYVLQRLTTGARSLMNRTQLIKLLEEKRVENAYVRRYRDTQQIRLNNGGNLPTLDISGIRRSPVNREEGARAESAQLYSEVIRALVKKDIHPVGDLTLSDGKPVFGSFSVAAEGRGILALFSVTEWKYGAAAQAGEAGRKGIVPDAERRHSVLASLLVKAITEVAGVSKVTPIPAASQAPIVPATDDDFSDNGFIGADAYTDVDTKAEEDELIVAEARSTEVDRALEDAARARAEEASAKAEEEARAAVEAREREDAIAKARLEAEALAAAEAKLQAEAETQASAETQTVVQNVPEEDPLGGLGDDVEAIFNTLRGTIVSNGVARSA